MCVTFAYSLETVDLKLCAKPSEASSWNCHPHFLLHPPTELRINKVFGFAFGIVYMSLQSSLAKQIENDKIQK